jgi:hypothetical protein
MKIPGITLNATAVPKKGELQSECINYISPGFFVSEKYENITGRGKIKLIITESDLFLSE